MVSSSLFRRFVALTALASLSACGGGASFSLSPKGFTAKADWAVKGMSVTLESWRKIANATGGVTYESKGSADMAANVDLAMKVNLRAGAPVDIVFVVDTTGSMQDDIDAVKAKLSALVDGLAKTNPDYQCGVVGYKDLKDDYLTKNFQALTHDKAAIQSGISALRAGGGGDWREHVYAGLDTGLREFQWRAGAEHRIILIGDAPPHESYKSDNRNYQSIVSLAKEKAVKINAIGVYCDTACQVLVSTLDGVVGGKP